LQQIALPGDGGRLGVLQFRAHLALLVVHHPPDPGAAEPSDRRAKGRSDQCALRVSADNLRFPDPLRENSAF
jgi:hypothetical protein